MSASSSSALRPVPGSEASGSAGVVMAAALLDFLDVELDVLDSAFRGGSNLLHLFLTHQGGDTGREEEQQRHDQRGSPEPEHEVQRDDHGRNQGSQTEPGQDPSDAEQSRPKARMLSLIHISEPTR